MAGNIDNSTQKLVGLNQFDRLVQSLNAMHEKDFGDMVTLMEQLDEIKADKEALQEVEAMLGGKSLRYLTQEEYDALSDEEKEDETIVYCIIDDETTNLITKEEKEYWNNKQDKEDESLNTTDKTLVGAINELELESFESKAELIALDNYKQDKEDENLNTEDKTVVGAINELNDFIGNLDDVSDKLNKSSLWYTFDDIEIVKTDYTSYLPSKETIPNENSYLLLNTNLNLVEGDYYQIHYQMQEVGDNFPVPIFTAGPILAKKNKDGILFSELEIKSYYTITMYDNCTYQDNELIKNDGTSVIMINSASAYILKSFSISTTKFKLLNGDTIDNAGLRFTTEEEKEYWNNKQDKEDENLNTENKTIVGAINEVNELIPCRDTRVVESLTYTFDGQTSNRELVNVTLGNGNAASYIKVDTLNISKIQKIESSYGDIKGYYKQTGSYMISGSHAMGSYEAVNENVHFVYDLDTTFSGAPVTILVLNDSNFLLEGQQVSLTKGIWTILVDDGHFYIHMANATIKVVTEGELKCIDTKYTSNKPGRIVESNGEVFNDIEFNKAGSYSHAEGMLTDATGVCAHAEGVESKATGPYSHAEGYLTTASGSCSHSEGFGSDAIGHHSHAEGHNSNASGDSAHAEGSCTEALGAYSHAEGYYTTASGEYQHVQGKHNIQDHENKYVHIVGNGEALKRSNAHTLDWDGNAWFAGDVTVGADNKKLMAEEDLPCYDTREIEIKEYTYDGTGTPFEDAVKVSDDVFTLEDIRKGMNFKIVTTYFSDNSSSELNIIKVDESNNTLYGVTDDNGVYAVYIINKILIILRDADGYTTGVYMLHNNSYYVSYFSFEKAISGEFKMLDEAYLMNKPGKIVEVPCDCGDEDCDLVYTGEIFNDIVNNRAGMYSHAEGFDSWALGDISHSEGYYTEANGFASHVEGYESRANGNKSHAEGCGCVTNAESAHAEGCHTIASSICQHVEGRGNIEDKANKYLHIVGNGTADARRNAYTLDWSGNAWFAGKATVSVQPTANNDLTTKLYVDNAIAQANETQTSLITQNMNESLDKKQDKVYVDISSEVDKTERSYINNITSSKVLTPNADNYLILNTSIDLIPYKTYYMYVTYEIEGSMNSIRGRSHTAALINEDDITYIGHNSLLLYNNCTYTDGKLVKNNGTSVLFISEITKNYTVTDFSIALGGYELLNDDFFLTHRFVTDADNFASQDYVDNAITELREEMVILEDDNLTIDGLIDESFPSLTTENKTLIGAINEINSGNENLQGQINELFQNVSSGKELIASAITDKGVDASEEETFQSLSEKISLIPSGPPGSNIIGYINENNDIYVSLTELESGTYTLKFEDYAGLLNEFDDIGTVEV